MNFLENATPAEYAAVVLALSRKMADESFGVVQRKEAATLLTNVVYSPGNEIQEFINKVRWLNLEENIRAEVLAHCSQALAAQDQDGGWAAQCLARVACVELPGGHCPILMRKLLVNITEAESTENLKNACLASIGHMLYNNKDPTILKPQFLQIYKSITSSLLINGQIKHIHLTALIALLEFLDIFTDVLDETVVHVIMELLFRYALSKDDYIAFVSLQCLTKFMRQYYVLMDFNEEDIIDFIRITKRTMDNPSDKIRLQCMKLWGTICREEFKLCDKKFLPLEIVNCLAPRLFTILECHEEDEWKLHKAVATCLRLLSFACEETIVEPVLTYVQQSIKHEDWHKRAAALMAYNSILEVVGWIMNGEDSEAICASNKDVICAIEHLMNYDPVPIVVDMARWIYGHVFDFLDEVQEGNAYLGGE